MTTPGPQLDRLTHRLADCPADFLAEPRIGTRSGIIHVAAVVNDLLLDLGGPPLEDEQIASLTPADKSQRARIRLVLVASWLLADNGFRQLNVAARARDWLLNGLGELASVVVADLFVTDPDRREELVRVCLDALGLRPDGESKEMAQDRLRTLDSVERSQLIRDTREKQERARKLREAMKKKEAEEAAAKATRE